MEVKKLKINRILIFMILVMTLWINLFPLNFEKLKNDQRTSLCLKVTIRKHHYFYNKGVYNKEDYYNDDYTVYATTRYFRRDIPLYNEINIYDDIKKKIVYIFNNKKIYMSVIPDKEPRKRRYKNVIMEKTKIWNTGIKKKYLKWNIEVWRAVSYGLKDSEIGMVDTFYYITRDLKFPAAYFNYYSFEEKTYTIDTEIPSKLNTLPGPSVWSITNIYDKAMLRKYLHIEEVIDIQYIKPDDSLFEIPKGYKEVEWNTDLFEH